MKEICENSACDISNCSYRHPKVCKWYREYRYCKFDPCLFLHKENDANIDILKKENEAILKNIESIEIAVKEIDAKIVHSETIIDRLETIPNKLEKCTYIEKLIFCRRNNPVLQTHNYENKNSCKQLQYSSNLIVKFSL